MLKFAPTHEPIRAHVAPFNWGDVFVEERVIGSFAIAPAKVPQRIAGRRGTIRGRHGYEGAASLTSILTHPRISGDHSI